MIGAPRTAETASRSRGDQGAAAVELAILLPVFLAITLAAVDFGLSMRQQVILRGAASNAANYAAVYPCDTTNIDGAASTELQGVSPLRPNIGTPQVIYLSDSGATAADCTSATQVEVKVTAPYNLLSGSLLGLFGVPTSVTVSGQETVRIEGR